jgi:hypothetical protein
VTLYPGTGEATRAAAAAAVSSVSTGIVTGVCACSLSVASVLGVSFLLHDMAVIISIRTANDMFLVVFLFIVVLLFVFSIEFGILTRQRLVDLAGVKFSEPTHHSPLTISLPAIFCSLPYR